jgi:hypothetical protein
MKTKMCQSLHSLRLQAVPFYLTTDIPIKTTLTINIATGPDAKIVAHAGPSSARMWPRRSLQNSQRSTGFKNDLKSFPLPQFGHLPLNPYHKVGAVC